MGVELNFDNNREYVQVKGDLTSATVMQALDQFKREGKSLSNWVIDFTKVGRVDSTAVALLIELKRMAKQQSKAISFIYLPESLLTIARLSQVESLLTESSPSQ
jgi:phospholipid transport system transporter-binding protein